MCIIVYAWLVIPLAMLVSGCGTGIEASDQPGILRVTLQADPADNSITVGGRTYEVSEADLFGVTVFQGKVYRDTSYATLYSHLDAFREGDVTYDLLEYDGDGTPIEHVIFESFVPPGNYDLLQFGFTATLVRVGPLTIPAQLPPNTIPLLEFDEPIEVFEHDTTVVRLQIKPFQSVVRFRDAFHFITNMEVVGITHY